MYHEQLPYSIHLFRKKATFFCERDVSTSPKPQAGGPPLVSCPRLILYVLPSAALRTRRAVVTGTHVSWEQVACVTNIFNELRIVVMSTIASECLDNVNCTAHCHTPVCSRPWTVACGRFTGAFTDINTQYLTTSLTCLN